MVLAVKILLRTPFLKFLTASVKGEQPGKRVVEYHRTIALDGDNQACILSLGLGIEEPGGAEVECECLVNGRRIAGSSLINFHSHIVWAVGDGTSLTQRAIPVEPRGISCDADIEVVGHK